MDVDVYGGKIDRKHLILSAENEPLRMRRVIIFCRGKKSVRRYHEEEIWKEKMYFLKSVSHI